MSVDLIRGRAAGIGFRPAAEVRIQRYRHSRILAAGAGGRLDDIDRIGQLAGIVELDFRCTFRRIGIGVHVKRDFTLLRVVERIDPFVQIRQLGPFALDGIVEDVGNHVIALRSGNPHGQFAGDLQAGFVAHFERRERNRLADDPLRPQVGVGIYAVSRGRLQPRQAAAQHVPGYGRIGNHRKIRLGLVLGSVGKSRIDGLEQFGAELGATGYSRRGIADIAHLGGFETELRRGGLVVFTGNKGHGKAQEKECNYFFHRKLKLRHRHNNPGEERLSSFVGMRVFIFSRKNRRGSPSAHWARWGRTSGRSAPRSTKPT